ncbi:MAG TPA: S41 family peptidase [Bryobacteraceae bacterium]|nr:S41 family peptidase [Bryobacteraceae bacterium]
MKTSWVKTGCKAAGCAVLLACALQAQAPRSRPVLVGDPGRDLSPSLKQFIDVLSTVESQAADAPPVDKLVYEGAIPAMLRQLDPHTQFFDPGQFQQLKQMQDSEQKGFGSIVSVLPGQVIFLQTFPGTPSNKAGIQPGDELIAVNNIAVQSLDPEQIVQLLTEARQQKITAFIRRQGYSRLLPFTLTPELVDSPSVDRAFLLGPGFGYIRVTAWDLQTAKQLSAAIQKLGAEKLSGLVLDLRNNPGGIVTASLDAAALFLQPGQRILTAKGRTTQVETADVPANAKPFQFKLAVIVNAKTASASEILSGALQDHDRAIIVGEPSYGKGLVQTVMPLSDGAGLAITTAFYYTPSGRSIQHPLRNSALSSTFSQKSTANLPTYKTDKGHTVTGGGGIQPDVLVSPPAFTRLQGVLDASGAVTSFATQYLANHSPLPAKFEVTSDVLDDFKVFLSARNIQPTVADWSSQRTWITSRLKEEITMQAQGVDKGDEIHAQSDPQIQAALNAMLSSLKDGALAASPSSKSSR